MNDKTIIRAEHSKQYPYTCISNETLQMRKLSYEARGMLGELLSRPDNWEIRPGQLVMDGADNTPKCGRDKTYRILNELIEAGYIVRDVQRESGKFDDVCYVIKERSALVYMPFPHQDETSTPPDTGKPDTVQPDTANPTLQSNEESLSIDSSLNTVEIKELSPSGDDAGIDLFALYADTPAEPEAVKESLTADVSERSFRGDDSQSPANPPGTLDDPSDESLREISASGGNPDVPEPGRRTDRNDRPESDAEEVPTVGSVQDTHKERGRLIERWPAFHSLPDTQKWAQITHMVKFLFGETQKKKLLVPLEKPLTLIELQAFSDWLLAEHRQVFQKLSSFETVAKYVDQFRHSPNYRVRMHSAQLVLTAYQNSVPLEPVAENPGAAVAALMSVVGADIFTMKKYDPTRADRLCQEINRESAAKRQAQ